MRHGIQECCGSTIQEDDYWDKRFRKGQIYGKSQARSLLRSFIHNLGSGWKNLELAGGYRETPPILQAGFGICIAQTAQRRQLMARKPPGAGILFEVKDIMHLDYPKESFQMPSFLLYGMSLLCRQ